MAGVGIPTTQHQLVLLPLRGAISGHRIAEEVSAVCLVPKSLIAEDSIAFQIEGDALTNEGLQDGDLILARPAPNDLPDGLVIAQVGDKVFIRSLTRQSGLALLSPISGSQPAIRVPLAQVTVRWVVTSLTRNFSPLS